MKKTSNKTRQSRKGFTIVEVTLVTAFVAILLITITIIITNISAIFQKGLTLKAVNSVGRNLVEELTTAIDAAPSVDANNLCNKFLTDTNAQQRCLEDGAYLFVFQEETGTYKDNTDGDSEFNVQYNGTFCTGRYSYLWNTHYGIRMYRKNGNNNGGNHYVLFLDYLQKGTNSDPNIELSYASENNNNHNDDADPFRIIRVNDPNYLVCALRIDPTAYGMRADAPPNYNKSNINIRENTLTRMRNPIEEPISGFLRDANDIQLQLYELVMFPPGQDSITQRAFFAGTFVLATDLGNINIVRSGDYCDLTGKGEEGGRNGSEDSASNISNLGSNFNYCAINKFNFAARTAGSGI